MVAPAPVRRGRARRGVVGSGCHEVRIDLRPSRWDGRRQLGGPHRWSPTRQPRRRPHLLVDRRARPAPAPGGGGASDHVAPSRPDEVHLRQGRARHARCHRRSPVSTRRSGGHPRQHRLHVGHPTRPLRGDEHARRGRRRGARARPVLRDVRSGGGLQRSEVQRSAHPAGGELPPHGSGARSRDHAGVAVAAQHPRQPHWCRADGG